MTAALVRPPPAGAMQWYAWLYTPRALRDIPAAVFTLAHEWHSLADTRVDHAVAHLKLQWWREELGRLEQGTARHPLTQTLGRVAPDARPAWQALQDSLTAVQYDLANTSYQNETELEAWLALADGPYRALALLLAPGADSRSLQDLGRAVGRAIRQVEVIRDLREDAVNGRIHLPLDWLHREGITYVELRAAATGPGARRCLERLAARARDDWVAACAALDSLACEELRGLGVLGSLHAALLERIARARFAVGARRMALGPLASGWTAWRAARQH